MSYRCSICQAVSPPGQAKIVYAEYRVVNTPWDSRSVKQVAAEHPVCAACKRDLDDGTSYRDLLAVKRRDNPREVGVVEVAVPPPEPPPAATFGRPAKTTTL